VALNVKAAMMICLGCIGGGSWLLQQVDVRQVEVRSPLVAVDATPRTARPTRDWMRALPPVESREAWTSRFARRNPLDSEAERNRATERPMTVALSERTISERPPLVLPPLETPVAPEATWPVVAEGELPVSAAAEVAAVVAAEPAADSGAVADLKPYQVVKGDTLSRIARRVFESRDPRLVKLLVELNPTVAAANGHLKVGDQLQIPDEPTALALLAAGRGNGLPAGASGVGGAAAVATEGERWYTIQPNDSLVRIAQRFLEDGGRWREIVKLNRALDPNNLRPGVRIKLPPAMRIAQG
jgi:nucleoid-associated protein YgaU